MKPEGGRRANHRNGWASCAEDVVEFMMAGANAVAIGAIFSNQNCLAQIPQDLNNWLDKHNVRTSTILSASCRRHVVKHAEIKIPETQNSLFANMHYISKLT